MEATISKIIYQETNPYGSLSAYLEDDGRTVYLYLQSEKNPEWKMKVLWIQNRIPAPKARSVEDMKSGLAPILCEEEIESFATVDPISAEDVYFIWTESGEGVVLFIKDKLRAFLPPWAGIKDFSGYSYFAKMETITAHPMGNPDHGPVADIVNESRKFWEYRSTKESWKSIQKLRLDFLESKFGQHKKYWSADGGKFPHLAIVKFQSEDFPGINIYATIGMSAQDMPGVEVYHKDFKNFSRIELIFAIKEPFSSEKSESWIPHQIGEIIRFPWDMTTWLGDGHTIQMLRRDPEALYLQFTKLFLATEPGDCILTDHKISPPDLKGLSTEDGRKINFIFLIPISEEESHGVRLQGAKTFLSQISERGVGWAHDSERESVL